MNRQTLKQQWQSLQEEAKEKKNRLFPRNAAIALGVSEATLLSCSSPQEMVQLEASPSEILSVLEKRNQAALDMYKVIVRNEPVVLEPIITITQIEEKQGKEFRQGIIHGKNNLGSVVASINLDQWKYSLVQLSYEEKIKPSLQLFDESGVSSFKLYAYNQEAKDTIAELVNFFSIKEPSLIMTTNKKVASVESDKDEVNREQNSRVVKASTVGAFLKQAVEWPITLKVKVCNQSAAMTYTGVFKRYLAHGEWENIIDSFINIHINPKKIDQGRWTLEKTGCFSLVYAEENGNPVIEFSFVSQTDSEDNSYELALKKFDEEFR